ncbi:MAG TPA: DUF2782 domain-containing protein [Dokdonella sp.]|uniref:DUF2782 domain-containing protein n=1 Tax=Dokdonella sp. TaxID=2291710 RepID=UPI002CF2F050|nr:DUF2782 domain-containing protein [Dokdonella sp.]HUD41423.1 DUF2782 domain-containing protein [Dokdonella sp.]
MTRPVLFATLLVLAMPLGAASPPRQQTPVLPPPTLEDPGVAAQAPAKDAAPKRDPAAAGQAVPATPPNETDALPKPDTRPARERSARGAAGLAERTAASDIAIRKQGDDTVEEYRQDGKVWMIRIVRPDGSDQTFMDMTGNGRLTRDPNMGPVAPVYFRLYEWN